MRRVLRKIRFSFRFFLAFYQKHTRLIILGFLAGITASIFLGKAQSLFFKKDLERVGLVGRFTVNELPLEIQQLISSGLTQISNDGQIKPALAESWEISDDGKEYTFTLKDNLYWQDGKPILSKDINYNFTDVTTSPLDLKRVKFKLKEPFALFPSIVSRPIFKKGFVGNSNYKVLQVKKNGDLLEKLVLKPIKSESKKIAFKFYPTEESAKTAYKLGEIDIIDKITDIEGLKTWKNTTITPEVRLDRVTAVFFNTQDSRLADKSVRQALAYAIDKIWQPRAFGPINPHSWAYNDNIKPYNFDLENAKKLLKNASPEDKNNQSLKEIELSTIPSLIKIAEKIKTDWEKLGIMTKIKMINSLNESFQALLITQEIPTDPDQYVFWHSTQESNVSRYRSPKIDKLLEEGRKTADPQLRKQIYLDFQRFLVEETPAVFLFHPTVYTVSKK